MTMDLKAFPPEILANVLGRSSSSYLIIRLWKCGDTFLNNRLANCVSYIDLKGGVHLPNFKLPTIVFKLRHLRYCSIVAFGMLMDHVSNWQTALQRLPSSIETLRLGSADLGPWLADVTSRGVLLPLSELFPRLHTLALFPMLPHRQTSRPLLSSEIPALPPTITCFESENIKMVDSTLMDKLPKSLLAIQALLIFTDKVPASFFANAPPLLHTINCIISSPPGNTISPSWLPKSLTRATIPSLDPMWDFEAVSSYPPLLSELELRNIDFESFGDSNWLKSLPRNLTRLSFQHSLSGLSSKSLGANIADLPPHLVELHIFNSYGKQWFRWKEIQTAVEIGRANNPIYSFWPSTLTSLAIPHSIMRHKHLPLLPSTLLSLRLTLHPEPPPFLETPHSNLFPRRLTHLNLLFNKKVGQIDPSELLYTFPANLTSLTLNSWSTRWFSLLSRNLTFLDMTCSYHFKAELLPQLSDLDLFADLPPALNHLQLSMPPSPTHFTLSSKSFSCLPHLKVLYVHHVNFPSAVLRSLSRALEDMDIRLSSTMMDNADIPFIPPKLFNFKFHSVWNASGDYLAQYWPIRCRQTPRPCPTPTDPSLTISFYPDFNRILRAREAKMSGEDY